jgi:hypothetical protein
MQDLRVRAQAFVHALSTSEFAKAAALFDDNMRLAVPLVVLSNTWKRLQIKVGRLRSFAQMEETRKPQHPEYRIILVNCEFDRGVFKMWLWFDQEGQISGMSMDQLEAPLGAAR